MGMVQTSSRGSTKQAGRWTWTGVCVGAGQKETQTAQGHRRSTKRNSGVRTDSVVTVGTAPRAGLQTSAKAVLPPDIFGHRAHMVGYGKVGNGKDAGNDPENLLLTKGRI